ncbi:MAG TPA: helix-turn-helix transcriptional regulator [Thermoanaerobaculia bacterium]|nr:helix-turn-helix transcriptional regulator [Thermoanaerobaculia bacterium]
MMLHDQLREARLNLGLSQADVAARAGIPRNQVARAEKGENITLDTLRKLVVALNVEELTLLEGVTLAVDVLPEPEKAYAASVQTISRLIDALNAAFAGAVIAQQSMVRARREHPLPDFGEPSADVDTTLLLKGLGSSLQELMELRDRKSA